MEVSEANSYGDGQWHRAVQEFHAHLDACEQCREHPFNLCPEGEKLLHQAGQTILWSHRLPRM